VSIPTLVKSVQIPITYEHYLRLEAIDLHDFSLVKRKVAQENRSLDEAYLDSGIIYLKRYYGLLILDTLNPPAMTAPIDPFWHQHVLLSADYTSFCDRVFGEYVHHIPLLDTDEMAVAFVVDFYNRTYKRHLEVYGNIDEKFFPRGAKEGACCSPSDISHNPVLRELALFPAQKFLHLSSKNFN
jgi:hypothetical protein